MVPTSIEDAPATFKVFKAVPVKDVIVLVFEPALEEVMVMVSSAAATKVVPVTAEPAVAFDKVKLRASVVATAARVKVAVLLIALKEMSVNVAAALSICTVPRAVALVIVVEGKAFMSTTPPAETRKNSTLVTFVPGIDVVTV
jgi:hypothetical protein